MSESPINPRRGSGGQLLPSNPFATRCIRPGALGFILPASQSLPFLLDQLREHDWCGQIVGPHGSGKSTLLAGLTPLLTNAGRQIEEIRGQKSEIRSRVKDICASSALDSTTQLIVDGFEQLSWLQQRKVKQTCRRAGAGLLVTTHTDVGLPMLFNTQPTPELARAVVASLLPPGDDSIDDQDITAAYRAAQSNVREMLFALYDIYQQRLAGRS